VCLNVSFLHVPPFPTCCLKSMFVLVLGDSGTGPVTITIRLGKPVHTREIVGTLDWKVTLKWGR
jgi:hypothetical protein